MVQLRSKLNVADNSGIKRLRVFGLYGGSRKRVARIGEVVRCSAISVLPGSDFSKGDKVKALIVRTRKEFGRVDGSYIRFDDNAAVIIDEQKNLKGTRVFGPVAREIRDLGYTKIASLAPEVL